MSLASMLDKWATEMWESERSLLLIGVVTHSVDEDIDIPSGLTPSPSASAKPDTFPLIVANERRSRVWTEV